MDLKQFGQSVKAKYPQYSSMSDEDVANAVIKKYPQYQSKIDQPAPTQQASQALQTPQKEQGFLEQQFSSEGSVTQTLSKLPGIAGTIGKFAGNIIESPRNIGLGAAKGALSTIQGIGQLGAKAINKVYSNFTGEGMPGIEQLAQGKIAFPEYLTKSEGIAQGVGKIAEQAAEFAIPGKLEMGAAKGASMFGEIAGMSEKAAQTASRFIAKPLAAGASYASIKAAQEGKAPTKDDFVTGVIFQGAGELLGATWRGVKGALKDNVGKALNFTGAQGAVKQMESGVKGLTTIAQIAPNITVKDVSGVEKVFEPAKADWWETAQALTKAKQSIYKSYTDAAAKAGDEGAQFVAKDFNKVSEKLTELKKNATADIRAAVTDIEKDFKANGWIKEDGTFNVANLSDMQDYVQNLNKSINAMSQAAKSVVSGEVSDTIRKIMDEKISSATGEAYQGLRNQYSDLLAIERPINNQLKKALRGSAGFSSYIEGYGVLDTVVAAITGNPKQALKGSGLVGLGATMKYLRDSENRLRWAFQQIQEHLEGKTPGIGGFTSGTVVPGAAGAAMDVLNPPKSSVVPPVQSQQKKTSPVNPASLLVK